MLYKRKTNQLDLRLFADHEAWRRARKEADTAEQYRLHFRFLETRDEAFEYAPGEDVPPQGRWTVSALGLSAEVLERVYRTNALRVLGA